MIDARNIRSPFAIGILAVSVTTAAIALVVGCTPETPPNTAVQGGENVTPETAGSGGGRRGRHLPPPEAFEGCKDKAIGTACTVSFNENEFSGQCEAPPPGSAQTGPSCRPAGGGRHHGRRGPPPEIIFAACDGKAAGDACSVAFEKGTVQGSCMAPKRDAGVERLLCAAARGHGRDGRDAGTAGGEKQ